MSISQTLNQLWRLDNSTALVTGASKGIGLGVAQQLLERGASVLMVARGHDSLHEAASTLKAEFGAERVHICTADLSLNEDRIKLLAQCRAQFSQLDILINNVGTNIRKATLDYSEAEYTQVINTNLTSCFELCRLFHPLLKQSSKACITNVSSVGGLTHLRTGSPYGMTKAAMIQLTKNLAVEWAQDGIRVNAIAPWYIETPLAAQVLSDPAYRQQVIQRTPMARTGTIAEAAAAIVALCLPASSYVTGQCLAVDGGFSVNGF